MFKQTYLKNEEICCITYDGKTAKNEWENDDSDSSSFPQCIKKLDQLLFLIYSLTRLKQDIPVLLKVINI